MNVVHRLAIALLTVAVLLLAMSTVRAGSRVCHRCGSEDCQQVCRLVCEEKELEITCWDSKCEEVCMPGPCKLGCKHATPACGECGTTGTDGNCTRCNGNGPTSPQSSSAQGGKKFVWRETIPGCPTILTQKKLLKKVEKKKVKIYKWVLEDLCGACRAESASPAVAQGTPVPPMPEEVQSGEALLLPIPIIGANARLIDPSHATARPQLSELISR